MNPFQLFFLLLVVIPIIEIYLLIQVGGILGALNTVVLIILTAVIGAMLIRIQGLSTWQRVQTSLANEEIPAIEMVEGIFLLIAGALLLTPGFFTDTIGFLCLIPALRQRFAIHLLQSGLIHQTRPGQQPTYSDHNNDVIEGEFHRDDDSDRKNLP